MHHTVVSSPDQKLAIILSSHHDRSKKRAPRKPGPRAESLYGTKSYNDALQRAFNRAKSQIFFNPDMTYFSTFTYAGIETDPAKVLSDIKAWVRQERRRSRRVTNGNVVEPKYVYVMEYQKRGSIHVHMISNLFFTIHVNDNGYPSITGWDHGFTSCLTIRDFDSNFRPYLYLFKYMRKAQRIGQSFLHTSRNLATQTTLEPIQVFKQSYDTIHTEYTTTTVDNRTLHFYRRYLKKSDTIPLPTK